mmetsp:Transcript_853/g.3331  ORF Transcript_853/g.3331 Transcript_853/m.3331 type:complete len:204 (+) Transcript_853:170-781(+)
MARICSMRICSTAFTKRRARRSLLAASFTTCLLWTKALSARACLARTPSHRSSRRASRSSPPHAPRAPPFTPTRIHGLDGTYARGAASCGPSSHQRWSPTRRRRISSKCGQSRPLRGGATEAAMMGAPRTASAPARSPSSTCMPASTPRSWTRWPMPARRRLRSRSPSKASSSESCCEQARMCAWQCSVQGSGCLSRPIGCTR